MTLRKSLPLLFSSPIIEFCILCNISLKFQSALIVEKKYRAQYYRNRRAPCAFDFKTNCSQYNAEKDQ